MTKLDIIFNANPLDRLDQVRGNEAEALRRKQQNNSVFLLFCGSDIAVNMQDDCQFSNAQLVALKISTDDAIILGEDKQVNYFAICMSDADVDKLTRKPIKEYAVESEFAKDKSGILAQGASVVNWHKSHLYCSYCGEKTHMVHSGWRRDCLTCEHQHFPRVDSVVIMLVTYGDQCLLGRGHHFLENRYSCLAGFIESGETIEDASRRELFEEVGIIGGEVTYMASQPWAFPYNLMIGMHVKAMGQKMTIDTHEIEDAIWVDKSDIIKVLNGDQNPNFALPPKLAIARSLLEMWVQTDY
ncbi:MAG: NAD(+) diphosphatase [Rhizobiales bacterium]|nr:NAD(+) diphosphatase [Hyphomicrobiales bacterium]